MKHALLLLSFNAAMHGMAQVLPLDSVLATIETAHPELRMYDAQVKAYETYATGARALDPPKLGAGFFMAPYNTSLWKADDMGGSGMGDPGMGSFMLSAEQMFTNGRKRGANVAYMEGMARVEAEMRNAARNEIFAMARRAYYEWLVMEKERNVLAQSEALLEYLVRAAEVRYTYGMDKLNAYYKAKAMLGDVQSMQLVNALDIDRMRIMLNTYMARDQGAPLSVDTGFVPARPQVIAADSSVVTERRSDLHAIDRNIDLLRAKQDLQRSVLRPDLGLKYDHMIGFGTQPQQFSLMGMVSLPIAPWSRKMADAGIAGLGPEMQALRESRAALINATLGEIARLQAEMTGKQQQLDLYDRMIIPSMRSNYETALLAYEQNTEELFMVLDAWLNLRTAQLARLDLLKGLYLLYASYDEQLEIR